MKEKHVVNKRQAIRMISGKDRTFYWVFVSSMRRGRANRYIFFEPKTKKNYEMIIPDVGKNCTYCEIPSNKRAKTSGQ
jgi:hypothetical protein